MINICKICLKAIRVTFFQYVVHDQVKDMEHEAKGGTQLKGRTKEGEFPKFCHEGGGLPCSSPSGKS